MPLSNSVIRRYTPPTCTLQLVARSSPLSRWVGRSVTKLLRFELRFDDPRLSEEQRVNIQGDRSALEALHEAVTTYVQDLLKSSPERFNAVFSALPSSSPDVAETETQAGTPAPRTLDSSDASFALNSPALSKVSTARPAGNIFLQPGRGLSHDLFLGPLANKETGPIIHLSVLQLFDLATALDEYAADVVALPTLSRPRSVAAPPAWTSIAAVLLLAVGLTTVVQLLYRSGSRQQTATTSATLGSSSNRQQSIALQPSPVPGVPTPPLSSLETLPPLPSVSSTLPSPSTSIPSVTVPRTPELPSPSTSIPSGTVPGTTLALKNAPQANVQQTTPVTPSTPRANAPAAIPAIPIPPITPPSPIFINPAPTQDRSSVSILGEPAPSTSDALKRQPTVDISPSSPVALPSAAIPTPSIQLSTPNPDLEAALSQATRGIAPVPEPSTTPTPQQTNDSASQRQAYNTPTTPNKPKGTAFDTIPQVAEVRDYFNQNWEPPSNLTKTLEYSIVLDVDGTIKVIEPLGQAARNYVDRSGMPLIGERFVSANKNGQTPRIRVVLAPDGKVQTFLEAAK